jgi:flagellar basal body-associated protein FliL
VNTRYLRIGISLEVGSEGERDAVSKRLVPLRDEFIRHLSSQEPSQLLSRNDKDKLREALLAKAQAIVPHKSVRQIYFTEFMMQ